MRKRKTSWAKRITIFFLLLIVAAGASGVWFLWGLFGSRGVAGEISIPQGDGVNEISAQLYDAGFINSKLVFETYLWARGLEGSIIAGTYTVPASNIKNLTSNLVTGPGPEEKSITFIEGWTAEDYADELEAEGLVSKKEFLALIQKPRANGYHDENYPILYSKPDSVDLEGYLFPDTYRVFKELTAHDVVDVTLKTLTKRISEQMAIDIEAQEKTIHEILTMASIIEKEVRTERDRRIVSGVLWKRIEVGMPLQVDSTVNYITGGNKPSVLISETQIDNPYNTYKYRGLPPGPIANPSLSAIQAAIYPTESEYWFYLSTPEGETIFSENLEQHAAAKQKYLK